MVNAHLKLDDAAAEGIRRGYEHGDQLARQRIPSALPERARLPAARQLIDEQIQEARDAGVPIECGGAGCCACCIGQLEIWASETEVQIIRERLLREGTLKVAITRARLSAANKAGTACLFLERTGQCSIYDDRPLACRAKHSLSRAACYAGPGHDCPNAAELYGATAAIRIHAHGEEPQGGDLRDLLIRGAR